MHRFIIPLLAVLLGLSACRPCLPTQPVREAADMQIARQQIEHERTLRAAAESRLEAEKKLTSRWRLIAVLGLAATLGGLVFGAILGSQARHEDETKTTP